MKPITCTVRLLFLACLLAGCTNGYEQFYRPNSGLANSPLHAVPFSGEPKLAASGGDAKRDVREMYEQGYVLVGVSDFVGPAANQAGATAQAKKVGAAIVLISSKYRNTVSGAMPLTLPTATTSYSSGNVNTFGSGGFATGNYSGTTTTYGTQTTYIPYSVDKYEQVALYFAPLERAGFGVMLDPLTDGQRRELESNQGVQITVVRNGSPAFRADVLPGDLLLMVGTNPTYDVQSALRALVSAAGTDTTVVLSRNGRKLTKPISIPAGDW